MKTATGPVKNGAFAKVDKKSSGGKAPTGPVKNGAFAKLDKNATGKKPSAKKPMK